MIYFLLISKNLAIFAKILAYNSYLIYNLIKINIPQLHNLKNIILISLFNLIKKQKLCILKL
jgi:hypothetical protein